jgi:uroporphyrinogen decarboxylase
MNSRQRVVTALNHKEPDRVPIDIGGTGATTLLIPAYKALIKFLGINKGTPLTSRFFRMAYLDAEILKKLGVDALLVMPNAPNNFKDIELDNGYIDEWGIKASKPVNSLYYKFEKHPLENAETVEDIKKYKLPDPNDPGRTEGLREKIEYLYENTEYALIGEPGDSVFERAWYLRGMENILNDLYFNQELLKALLDMVSDYFIAKVGPFLDIVGPYIDVFFTGDDLGTQNGPLLSPEMYKKIIKPFQKKVFDFIKSKTDAKLIFHSCGSIFEFIPDLIEIGVDGINPVQTTAYKMDAVSLKKEFGRDLSFWGGIDTQKTLPFGTDEELKKEIENKINDLGSKGGYVMASVHTIQPDVSPEKIIKMIEYGKDYGYY